MAYHLSIVFGVDAGTVFAVEDGQRCAVGRSDASDIRLDDEAVAWEHAVLIVEDNRLFVENLSALGTKVNGRPVNAKTRVVPGDRVELAPNAVLSVGSDSDAGSGGGVSMITVLALLAVLVLGAGVAATVVWNFFLKDQFVQTAEEVSRPSDWKGAYRLLSDRVDSWVETGEMPIEFASAFERARRLDTLGEQSSAHSAYGGLITSLMQLEHPVHDGTSFAAHASRNGEELAVLLGQTEEDPTQPAWASDERYASALVWFVRVRYRQTEPAPDTSRAFGGL